MWRNIKNFTLIIISKLQLSGETEKKKGALVLVCFPLGRSQAHCQSHFCVVCGQPQCFKRHLSKETSQIYCLLIATVTAITQTTSWKRQYLVLPLNSLRTLKSSKKTVHRKHIKREIQDSGADKHCACILPRTHYNYN